MHGDVWVSFCMSTYKRPVLLEKQLNFLLQQSFKDFEIVISDNDPDESALKVVELIGDKRVKYFSNMENLGMVRSFNKSIDRAVGKYIVMITDDDPVEPEMLETFYGYVKAFPDLGIYCACQRANMLSGAVEVFDNTNFAFELLHPNRTTNLLWSSCLLDVKIVRQIGGMPDYGSPHLADHAMLALCGTINGGLMINRMFSSLTQHEGNFSKSNLQLYYIACTEFFKLISNSLDKTYYVKGPDDALQAHLGRWFITFSFALRRHFSLVDKSKEKLECLKLETKKLLMLPFMKKFRVRFSLKLLIFNIKMLLK